jgi:ribonuclease HI
MDIYTDGAYSSKTEKGGWAFYMPDYKMRVCGSDSNTTNNRMELTAVIKALEFVVDSNLPDKELNIYSDSNYVVQTMLGNFSKKTNMDLWDKLDLILDGLIAKKIIWNHIKGHTGEKNGNYIVDLLANLTSQHI